jgi:O-antigen/teichoic acid export membrane protein
MKFGTARRITANFLSLISSQIISRILQLIIFVYLARVLGKSDFGIFSFGLAFAFLFVVITDFGLSTVIIREISRDKKSASKYLSNSIMIKLLLSAITLVSAYLFLNIAGYPGEVKIIAYIMLGFTLLQSFTELYYAIFRAFERMYYDAFIKILRVLILAGAIFYLIENNYGLLASSLAFLATEFVVLMIAFFITYTRFIKISFEFDYGFSKKLLKKSSLFCLSLVFSTLYMYIDVIMLSKMRSTAEVGIYSAATSIVIALIFIPLMYGNSIYPVLSRFYITSKESLRLVYEKSFKYMLIIGLPAAAGIYILSDKIILLLYGKAYIESAIALSILSGYLFLKFLNPVSGFTLMAINKQRSRLFSQGLSALINIILNLIFIPIYGFVGAAIATLLTEIIFFITYTSFVIRYGFNFRFVVSFIYKPIIAVAVMIFSLFFIESLFLAIILGALAYFIVLLALRILDKEDKILFNKIVKNI